MSESTEPAAQPTPANVANLQQAPDPAQPLLLPDDHPLVKTLAAQKDQIRTLKETSTSNAEKARLYDEIEEANKSEMQKLVDRAEKAESIAAAMQAAKDRDQLAATVAQGTDVPPSLLTADTEEGMRAQLAQLIEFRGTATPPPPSPAAPAALVGNVDAAPPNQIKQLTQAELAGMSPAEILAADREGRLNALKGTS